MTDTPPGAFHLADMSPKRRRPLLIPLVAAGVAVIAAVGVLAFVLTRPDDPKVAVSATPTTETAASSSTPTTSPSPRVYTAAGSVSTISGESGNGASCQGAGPNSDITEGATLLVLNAAGDRIAEAKLGPGLLDGLLCVFQFIVKDVPSGAGTYRLTIGTRKAKSYSEADFAQGAILNILL